MNLLSCATCQANSITAAGEANPTSWAILVMLLILFPMLSMIAFFLFRFMRRDRDSLPPELRDEYVRPLTNR